ncbi:hypothetical protein BDF22DRAFT_683366 [Syncephalis plumigaleata]|nr:hypothetical protein BDF22DRAFT_683366 [Syncephalis plumigaleata]
MVVKGRLSPHYKLQFSRFDISTPLTLASVNTTIWEIGHLITDERKASFMSSRSCIFYHPYPVGYRASKHHFGREYWMTIEADEEGPIFSVFTEDGRHNFQGRTPTFPWTQACVASTTKGTRISGPLFFGFSDPLTQWLIQQLPGYDVYDDVDAPTTKDDKPIAVPTVLAVPISVSALSVSASTHNHCDNDQRQSTNIVTAHTTTTGWHRRDITQSTANFM